MTDIAIVGAGCAGMTAAVYAARAGKTVALIECESIGGQIAASPKVENYPTYGEISGLEFSDKLFQQAEDLGAELHFGRVLSVEEKDGFVVKTDCEEIPCRSVILATGAKHRHVGVAGEEKLIGKGVSYCAVCDGAFFRGADVAVIGGGSAALQSAEYLSHVCNHVTLIHRRNEFRGEKKLAQRVAENEKITLCLSAKPTEILGEGSVSAVRVALSDGSEKEIPVTGVFVAVGQEPKNEPFAGLVTLDEAGYVDADETCITTHPGIFVAGDCRKKKIRQLTTAAADGTVAALAACDYVDNL